MEVRYLRWPPGIEGLAPRRPFGAAYVCCIHMVCGLIPVSEWLPRARVVPFHEDLLQRSGGIQPTLKTNGLRRW